MKKFFNIIYSTRLMAIAILLFAVAMAVATFIENDFGTPTAKAAIYNTKWFELLMLILTINFIGNIFKYRLLRREKWPVLVFHLAFILTLVGAFVTRYYSYEGIMPIREGKQTSTVYSDKTFVNVRVDNDKAMKNYSQEVLFVKKPEKLNFFYNLLIPNNSFSMNGKFHPPSEEKEKGFSIELVNFTPKAKEVFVPDEQGKLLLHIVESSSGSRNDIFLKEGDIKNIKNILFSFNNELEGGMNFTSKDGKNTLQPVFDGTYMMMQTQELTNVPKDSIKPLQFSKLYTFDDLRFVVKGIAKGRVEKVASSKKEEAFHPYDALTLKLKSGDEEKLVDVRGIQGSVAKPAEVKLNGLNYTVSYGSKEYKTPFKVYLKDFELKKYPGSNSPSSFASEVTVKDKEAGNQFDYRIYMNHVLDYKGYRFFQSQYDKDEKGTILSVNHDYWGTLITYLGYLLMGIGMFFSLFWKGTRFTKLSEKLKTISKKKLATILLFLSFIPTGIAQDINKHTVSRAHADKFGRLQIQDHQGRVKPINTYALEIIRKVHKKDTYKGLTAEQVLLSAQLDPQFWSSESVIQVKMPYALGSELANKLKIKDKKANIMGFFDKGHYILGDKVEEAYRKKNANRTASDKAIMNLDEQANVWLAALKGSLMNIYPKRGDKNNTWYTGMDQVIFVEQDTMVLKMHKLYMQSLVDAIKTNDYTDANRNLNLIVNYQKTLGKDVRLSKNKVDLEIKYNRWNIFFKVMIYYFMIGFIFLALAFADLFYPKNRLIEKSLKIFTILTVLGMITHVIGMGLRWYISGHEPWSNGYEAVVFVSFVTTLAGVIFGNNRSKFILAVSVLFAGFLLGIAHGSMMTPEVTNLVPVLKSYWLMIHVAVITGSYGFLGLSALLGFVNLTLYIFRNKNNKKRFDLTINELTYVNELAMTVGLYMLSIGTFLGGVWASESWGRYWSWDPKEVWSLISMMIYIFILHMRMVPGLQGKFTFNLMSLFSIGTLIMTFFGVNYYLSGMHSYAAGDPVPIPFWVVPSILGFVAFAIFSYTKYRKFAIKEKN
jgi:cytochrome c-type biogenesis protein CcsB